MIHIPGRNFSAEGTGFFRRAGRFANFADEKWMQVDESSPPYLPSLGGLSFPLFAPNLAAADPVLARARGLRGPPFPSSLDYDQRASGQGPSAADVMSRMPSNSYYDSPQNSQPIPAPGNGPARGYAANSPSLPERPKYQRPERQKYGPYGTGSPAAPGKGRPKSSSNSNYGPPPDPFYPDYEEGVPHYSYNPNEVPRCAKESNASWCVEDDEYPM